MKKKHFKQRARESHGLKYSLKTACAGGNSLNKLKIIIIKIFIAIIINFFFFFNNKSNKRGVERW